MLMYTFYLQQYCYISGDCLNHVAPYIGIRTQHNTFKTKEIDDFSTVRTNVCCSLLLGIVSIRVTRARPIFVYKSKEIFSNCISHISVLNVQQTVQHRSSYFLKIKTKHLKIIKMFKLVGDPV